MPFWTALWVFFFPCTRRGRGRRIVFPCICPFPPFSEKTQKDADNNPITCLNSDPWPTTRRKNRGDEPLGQPWGGCLGHPIPMPRLDRGSRPLSPCFLPINTGEERVEEMGEEREKRAKKGQKKKKKEREKKTGEKKRKKKGEEHR